MDKLEKIIKLVEEARDLNEELWIAAPKAERTWFGTIDSELDNITFKLKDLVRRFGGTAMFE